MDHAGHRARPAGARRTACTCPPADATGRRPGGRAPLGAIELGLRPGAPGPAAFGALPFDPAAAGQLVVPAVQLGRDARRHPLGDCGSTRRRRPAAPAPVARREARAGAGPAAGALHASPRRTARWPGAVVRRRRGADPRRRGCARWCWPARSSSRPTGPSTSRAVLRRLRRRYPACYLLTSSTASWAPAPSCWCPASGDVVRAQPMAGTTPRLGDPAADARLAAALLASAKDRHEHQVTIDMVHDTLLPWCSYLDAEPEPSVVAVANVQHLATLVEGRLSRPAALGARAGRRPAPHPGGGRRPPRRGPGR